MSRFRGNDAEQLDFGGPEAFRRPGRRPSRRKRECEACRSRRARFRHRGVVKADASHTLCFQCYKAERDRLRARQLLVPRPALPERAGPRPAWARPPALDEERLAHRMRMLAHLRRQAQIAARRALGI